MVLKKRIAWYKIYGISYIMMTKFIGGVRKTRMCCFSPCFPLSIPQFAVRLGSPEMLSRSMEQFVKVFVYVA